MDPAQVFLVPQNSTHRQYEALRAYFVDRLPAPQVADRFGYTLGSLRQLVHQFRESPHRRFFAEPAPRGVKASDAVRDQIVRLRKQNLSVYDISEALKKDGIRRTSVAVGAVLKKEGFAKLPRRLDEERPPGTKPTAADRADVRTLSLEPRSVRSKFGGLFLFLPALAAIGFDRVIGRCDLPGTQAVPAACAVRSLLALKLFGTQRHTHVMSAVLDEGLAWFAGLNVIPKRSFLTEYSCRIVPACYPRLMRHWFDAMSGLGLEHGSSFDLDFHTIPFHGEDALVEKHYVSKRSRRQKGILAFVAQDGEKRFFCYANSDLRKDQQDDEILRFAREAHRALCPADADRKQHRRRRELLPHRRAVQCRGVEGQLRPPVDADGQQPVSLSRPAHRQIGQPRLAAPTLQLRSAIGPATRRSVALRLPQRQLGASS
jgi:hypothetical protein